jgi:hypothetical protein
MTRRHRYLAAVCALFALLTSQLAVSAYVCALMGPAPLAVEVDKPLPGDVMAPCAEMLDSANLCQQHCGYGHSAVDQGKPLPLPAANVGTSVALRVGEPCVLDSLLRRSLREPPLPPQPPPAIRFSVLRI